MLTTTSSLKGQGTNKQGRLTEKSLAFHGRVTEDIVGKLTIPRTVPDITSDGSAVTTETMTRPKLTRLLLNVTIQRNVVPVHVLISPESTVGDLIAAALRQYFKEGRRPVFPSLNPPGFDLHYSQFSLENLSPDEKLNELGSRNFFLRPKPQATVAGITGGHGGTASPPSSSTCSNENVEVTIGGEVGLGFMEFML